MKRDTAQKKGAQIGVVTEALSSSGDADCLALQLLNALPHPLLSVGGDGSIHDVNPAAELFFAMSRNALRRIKFTELLPFGSPLVSAIEQVRQRRAPINEYRVDLGTPKIGIERYVDIHIAPLPNLRDGVVVMLQERTIADKMDRQLTHRGAARSLSAMGAMLAHEIRESLVGHSRRGAIARNGGRGRGSRLLPADLRRNRPDRASC